MKSHKSYKQILEQLLSESNPTARGLTWVPSIGTKPGAGSWRTHDEIQANKKVGREAEEIISNANKPKPGTSVPLTKLDAYGNLLPSQQKPKPKIPDWVGR